MELYPDVSFVWIMGSDCAAEISQWKDWEKFINLIPIAIYPRPSFEIESDKLDLIKNNAKQIDLSSQENFSICKPPVITFIPGPMSDISSSQIRKVKMYKTLDNILTQLEDNKALDIISIDLKGKSDIADFLVIATGTSNRHVGSLSENLISELKKDGIKDIKAEGINKSDWVLIDSGDVIVHIFRKEVREFYNLEKLWQTNIDTN